MPLWGTRYSVPGAEQRPGWGPQQQEREDVEMAQLWKRARNTAFSSVRLKGDTYHRILEKLRAGESLRDEGTAPRCSNFECVSVAHTTQGTNGLEMWIFTLKAFPRLARSLGRGF